MNTKAASERYQRQVLEISKQSGNEVCADCRGRYPRWASWNLGIFLCVNCAGVHRKMGTHISKIKSLTLDTWTKEMVEKMREGGNIKNNLRFNPDERRNRPPANVDEGERNSELERFIFDKYKGRFMEKAPPVPSKDLPTLRLPDSSVDEKMDRRMGTNLSAAAESISRSRTAPIPTSWADAKRAASTSPSPAYQQQQRGSILTAPSLPTRAPVVSKTLGPPTVFPTRSTSTIAAKTSEAPSQTPTAGSSVFDDLISLSTDNTISQQEQQQPPLQMQSASYQNGHLGNPWAALGTHQQALISPMMMTNTAASSYFQQAPTQTQQQQQISSHAPQFFSTGAQERSASLGTMAFSNTSPFPAQSTGNPYFSNYGAQMMGIQAFGQYQQPPQVSPLIASHQNAQSSYMQQQQQPSQQQPPPFGNFANAMMPLQAQSTASHFVTSPWQTSQNINNQNMWQ